MPETRTKTITIDPKMFIGKPFTDCPKCKKQGTYGSLMISGGYHTKRCNECWYSQSYKLPPLDKKVIYLDQFVISNMMKAINDKLGKKQKVDKVYLKLFEVLDKMVKLQLIICPDSEFHREESLLSFYTAIKRMYEQLSYGNTFYDAATIRRFQLCEDFKSFLKTQKCDWKTSIDVDSILHGDRNEWQDRLLITVDSSIKQDEIELFRKSRLTIHENFKKVFEAWQKEKTKPYQTFFEEIASSYGTGITNRYVNSITQYFQASMGIKSLTTEDVHSFTGEESVLVSSLLRYFPDASNDAENLKTVITYLKSNRLEHIPFNEIYSSLWAAIAYQASRGGRTAVPNIGMFNDVEMVSTLLPYCDAIFVDKDMHSILNFAAVKKIASNYKTEFFSLTNIDDFFNFLKKIEGNTTQEHFQLVSSTYGEDWGTPFYEMYRHEHSN